ncbi:MAG: SPFH domain-containing protein [Candidatus Riflebacteria bacterium]|nr:SPFH domain-containing protein [Candidatus Riflebacteria bacterium]
MPLIGYFKSEPTEYIMLYSAGSLKITGVGITFFYLKMNTSIVLVPTGTIDVPFILNETTGNFQAVTIQGQMTYRISDPKAIASIMDYTIDPRTRQYRSEDPEKLSGRIINEIQAFLREELQKLSLEDALKNSVVVATKVNAALCESKALGKMGIETTAFYINSIKPTPEMARALEAEYRESLQVRADQAIYHRRAIAVEQEGKIKQNELNNSITLENRKKELIALQGENLKQEAEFQAHAVQSKLAPYQAVSPKILLALALKEMGENAAKIGNLNITPEILSSILANRD